MPIETAIGNTTPEWEVDVAWPSRYTQTAFSLFTDSVWINGPAFLTGVVGSNLGRTISSFAQGGAGANEYAAYYAGLYSSGMYTTGAVIVHAYGNIPIVPAVGDGGGVNIGGLTPEWTRAQWVRVVLAAYPGAVFTTATGVAMQLNPGPLANSQWAGAGAQPNQGAFGVYGDGAGGWQFLSYDGTTPGPAVALVTAALPAPSVPNGFQTVDFFLTGASGDRTATLDVYVNGALLPGASQLPVNATGAAGSVYFPPTPAGGPPMYSLTMRVGDLGAANRLIIGEWRIRCGRYTYDGAELRS